MQAAMRKMSIGSRILLLTLLPSIGMAVVLTAFLLSERSNDVKSTLLSKAKQSVEQLSTVAGLLEFNEDQQTLQQLARITLRSAEVSSVRFIDRDKRTIVVLGKSMQLDQIDLARQQVLTENDRSITISAPVNGSQGELMGWVQVTFSRADTAITGYQERIGSFLLLSLSALFALLLANQTSRHITHSLQRLTTLLDRICSGESRVEIATDSGGELGKLEESIKELTKIKRISDDELRHDLEQTPQEYQEILDTPQDSSPQTAVHIDTLPFADIRVLAVDDNEANLKLLCILLDDLGVDVTAATNGPEAVALAGQSRFDLIFMDVQMPVMSGIEAAERIHALRRATPVVALTAHALADEIENLLNSGMDDYIIKPINESCLRTMLLKWVSFDAGKPVKPVAPVVDWKLAYQLAGGKKDLAKEMLSMLLSSMPDDLTQIKSAYDSHNLVSLQDAVHRLHGAIRYCGVPGLHSLVKNLETMIKQDKWDQLDDAMNQLYSEVSSLQSWANANNLTAQSF